MTPDYAQHDEVYRRRHAAGQAGWDSPAVAARVVRRLETFLAEADLRPPGRLLDLGCGAGNVTLHLAATGCVAACCRRLPRR